MRIKNKTGHFLLVVTIPVLCGKQESLPKEYSENFVSGLRRGGSYRSLRNDRCKYAFASGSVNTARLAHV